MKQQKWDDKELWHSNGNRTDCKVGDAYNR